MSSLPELKLDWCSHAAAKYAVEKWHYSGVLPGFKTAKVGVWENGKFVDAIVYGLGGGNACNGQQYGLKRNFEMAELQRVAMTKHITPTSKCVAISVKMIKKAFPKLRLLISFADTAQGHAGTIYQAGNWVFTGSVSTNDFLIINDQRYHPRSVSMKYGKLGGLKYVREHIDPHAHSIKTPVKHRYLIPLDDEMKQRIERLRKPYPKNEPCAGSADSGTSDDQSEGGGATPTPALSSNQS